MDAIETCTCELCVPNSHLGERDEADHAKATDSHESVALADRLLKGFRLVDGRISYVVIGGG